MTIDSILRKFGACNEALIYGAQYKVEHKQLAWDECRRGDWMLWIQGQLAGEPESEARKKLVLCACDCASLALKHTKDKRVRACIIMARKWARGKATISQMREARTAADAAAAAAYAAATYAAAVAAATATAAAVAAATAAAATDAYAAAAAAAAAAYAATYAAAADATYAAADAAAADAYAAAAADADARQKTLSKCAAIVRKHYPIAPTT